MKISRFEYSLDGVHWVDLTGCIGDFVVDEPFPMEAAVEPIKVDFDRMQIGDMALIAYLSGGLTARQASLVFPSFIALLDRIVVGGISTRPADQLQSVCDEVMRQLNAHYAKDDPPLPPAFREFFDKL